MDSIGGFVKGFPYLVDTLRLGVDLVAYCPLGNVPDDGTAMSMRSGVAPWLVRDLNGFCFEMITIHLRQRL
jgi:hypothetical protein